MLIKKEEKMKTGINQLKTVSLIFGLATLFYSVSSQAGEKKKCIESFLDNPKPVTTQPIILSPYTASRVFKIDELIKDGDNANLASLAIYYQAEITGKSKAYVVNLRNDAGETPLTVATRNGRTQIAKYLLDLGADPSAETQANPSSYNTYQINGRPMTPIKWASKEGHLEILKLLLKVILPHKAEKDSRFELLDSLTLATQNGHKDIIEFLFKSRSQLIVNEDYAYSILISATVNGHKDIADYIMRFCRVVN